MASIPLTLSSDDAVEAGILGALPPNGRCPESKRNPREDEDQMLRRENVRLSAQLQPAKIIIDVHNKVADLLGRTLLTLGPEEKS